MYHGPVKTAWEDVPEPSIQANTDVRVPFAGETDALKVVLTKRRSHSRARVTRLDQGHSMRTAGTPESKVPRGGSVVGSGFART